MSDLKKLNNAIAGIDDGLLADAMSSSETKQSVSVTTSSSWSRYARSIWA